MTETVPADIAAAIVAFDLAAQDWGWEADQGAARDADRAERKHADCRAALDAAILAHLRAYAEMKAALERIEQGV